MQNQFKVKFFLIASILFAPLLLNAQHEEWDVYMVQYEKHPGSIMLNMALNELLL